MLTYTYVLHSVNKEKRELNAYIIRICFSLYATKITFYTFFH